MIATCRLTVPVEQMSRLEMVAADLKCKMPGDKPALSGLRTEIRLGRNGAREEFWLSITEDVTEPTIGFIGNLARCAWDRWGEGWLDLIDGGFVWTLGGMAQVKPV